MSASPPLRLKKEALDTVDRRQVPRSRSERPRQHRRNNGPLELVAKEGRGENEVM
jgi:hypothetical protein